jgi:omega-6 fatty acid desaturase / acyl-lipid omega-6 desaturase (Delta-12 desaturase)
MFSPHHYGQVILSDIGILVWLAVLATWIYYKGFAQVFTLYIVPYLWYAPTVSFPIPY